MIFTFYSFMMDILWVSLFAISITLLRKKLLEYFSIYTLIFILFLCIVRLFLFFELPFTKTINCKRLFPFLQKIICTNIINVGFCKISIALIFLLLWGIFAIRRCLKILTEYIHLRRTLNLIPATQDTRLYKIFSQIDDYKRSSSNLKIIVHKSVKSPAIIGFFKPIIILPEMQFSDDELLGIFAHEWTHYCYGHIFIKLLTEIIISFFWWDFAFKNLHNEISHVLEMHSDKIICAKLNSNEQRAYLNSIQKVISHISEPYTSSSITCYLVEENSSEKLIQRFKMILDKKYVKKSKKSLLLLPFICGVFIFSYTIVLQPYAEPTAENYGTMESIIKSDYLVKTKSGNYILYNAEGEFIAEINHIDESLKNLKVYREDEIQ